MPMQSLLESDKVSCKDFTTIEQQIHILKDRGLSFQDEAFARDVLKRVSYYRLSAYSLSLRRNDVFFKGITFENIYELYLFDETFRQIILKATLQIEAAFRSHISYHHSEKYGPLGYLNNQYFDDEMRHAVFLQKMNQCLDRSKDAFVQHHRDDLKKVYPFWVALEVISFDMLSKLYKNLLEEDRTAISKYYYGIHREYIENWLQGAVIARNICAHGGRFYNRIGFGFKIKLSDNEKPRVVPLDTAFPIVYAIYRLLPGQEMRLELISDIKNSFIRFPFAQKKKLGLSDNWDQILLESCAD